METPRTSREALLNAAKTSPEIAAAHDKAGWLALYSADAIVADPVGAPPSHAGRRRGRHGDELGRFYEAFIAPTEIYMTAKRDIVSEMSVFRAVTIHTTNQKTGLQLEVPANLLYEIIDSDGVLLIGRMHAHWEIRRMSRVVLSRGSVGIKTVAAMNWNMLRAFGPRWLAKYFAASTAGVGRKGKDHLRSWASAADSGEAADMFATDASIRVPEQGALSPSAFAQASSALAIDELTASGSTVSGLASIEWGGRLREAALIAEFDAAGERMNAMRWFWEE